MSSKRTNTYTLRPFYRWEGRRPGCVRGGAEQRCWGLGPRLRAVTGPGCAVIVPFTTGACSTVLRGRAVRSAWRCPRGKRARLVHLCSCQLRAVPGLPRPEVMAFLCLPRCVFIDLPLCPALRLNVNDFHGRRVWKSKLFAI